ncbi:MAG: ATP synthase subunit I [Burkholderiales bacterium]|nr:ATP synthase subunit I [Burkholderiales bacterium]
MSSWITVKPLQTVLRWQLLSTVIIAIGLAVGCSSEIAVSALLGGMVSVISSAVFAMIVSRHQGFTAGGTIRTALRAEAVKITLIVLLLWLVFKVYEDVNAFAFIGMFTLTVIMHSMALFVSEKINKN